MTTDAQPAPPAPAAADDGLPLAERLRLRRVYGATGLSAVLLYASFHPIDWGALAFVALVPLLYVAATERLRTAAVIGYAATFLFHLVGLAWIALVTPEGWLLTAFLEGFYGVALVVGSLWIRSRTGLPLLAILPPLGAALEWIRGNTPWIAFPWLLLGHTQHEQDVLIQVADVTSVYGLSFLVLLVNAAIVDAALLLRSRAGAEEELSAAERRRLLLCAGAPLAAIAVVAAYGLARRAHVRANLTDGPRLLVVQLDIPQSLKDEPTSSAALAQRSLVATRAAIRRLAAAEGEVDLDAVIWSETMWPWPIPDYRSPDTAEAYDRWFEQVEARARDPNYAATVASNTRQLFDLPARYDLTLLVGAVDTYWPEWTGIERPEHNSYFGIAPAPGGEGARGIEGARVSGRYDKVMLVPASEYIPGKGTSLLGWFYGLIKSFVPPGFTTFEPGEGPVLIEAGDHLLAPNICFEISFAELLRRSTAAGADVHVCPANDAWFVRGGRGEQAVPTAEVPLARDHSIFRAIENRRSVVRCVNRGVSLVVNPLGEVTDEVVQTVDRQPRTIGVEGTLLRRVQTSELQSFYVRFGNVFAWLCALVSIGLLVHAWRRKPTA